MKQYHTAVLAQEIGAALQPSKGKVFIDATLGGGGHTKLLIDQGACVYAFDQDEEAIAYVSSRTDINQDNLTLIPVNFEHMSEKMHQAGVNQVDGIVFDLGVSSHQFDTPERGFSFQYDAPLDMRMSSSLMVTAADLINGLGKRELYDLFTKYGDEQLARPISEAIIRARQKRKIETTKQLANIVEKVYRNRRTHLHPATKVFQALRIAINDELNTLKVTLPQAEKLLKKGGKLAVISFHEGEDRLVKHFLKDREAVSFALETKKPIKPEEAEIAINPRSRSAKLRVATKL